MSRPGKGEKLSHKVSNLFHIMILYFCTLGVAYLITSILFYFTGRPVKWISLLIFGFISFVTIVIVIWFLLRIRNNLDDQHQRGHRLITDALREISQGNFDIFLDAREPGLHPEFTEEINKMAQNLGNLETMRQDFISNVSHEIQSPLTSIGGFATILKQENLSLEQRLHYASIIEAESKRLSSLSDNLLKLSTLDNKTPLVMACFSLDKQLKNIMLTLEPQWSIKNLILEIDATTCTYYGDENLLSQVWINVLHNAIKFTPENGQIMITLTQDEKSITVTISDTGVGISSENQIHIFERFYKADKARERALGGNGLGLSLVKKIIDLHDGKISVESILQTGTTFIITLPKN